METQKERPKYNKRYTGIIIGLIVITILFSGCIGDKQNQYDQSPNTTYKESDNEQIKPSFPDVPMNVNLSIDKNLYLGQETKLEFTVTPFVNAPNTIIQVFLPKEFELISGETSWNGNINKNKTIKVECIIKIPREGFYIVKAQAIFDHQAGYKVGGRDALYINISKDNVTISHNVPEHKRARQNITYAQWINNSVIHEQDMKNDMTPMPATPSES